jgi:hypothetical protein
MHTFSQFNRTLVAAHTWTQSRHGSAHQLPDALGNILRSTASFLPLMMVTTMVVDWMGAFTTKYQVPSAKYHLVQESIATRSTCNASGITKAIDTLTVAANDAMGSFHRLKMALSSVYY